MVDTCQT